MTEALAGSADWVVSFVGPDELPGYVDAHGGRVADWSDVPNPGGQDLEFDREVRDEIVERVDRFRSSGSGL